MWFEHDAVSDRRNRLRCTWLLMTFVDELLSRPFAFYASLHVGGTPLGHLDRQHWLTQARQLARSARYADLSLLDEELRSYEWYHAAAEFLQEPAIRYQLKLLCERSQPKRMPSDEAA